MWRPVLQGSPKSEISHLCAAAGDVHSGVQHAVLPHERLLGCLGVCGLAGPALQRQHQAAAVCQANHLGLKAGVLNRIHQLRLQSQTEGSDHTLCVCVYMQTPVLEASPTASETCLDGANMLAAVVMLVRLTCVTSAGSMRTMALRRMREMEVCSTPGSSRRLPSTAEVHVEQCMPNTSSCTACGTAHQPRMGRGGERSATPGSSSGLG